MYLVCTRTVYNRICQLTINDLQINERTIKPLMLEPNGRINRYRLIFRRISFLYITTSDTSRQYHYYKNNK